MSLVIAWSLVPVVGLLYWRAVLLVWGMFVEWVGKIVEEGRQS